MSFALGIIVGLLLSALAFMAGKRYTVVINQPYEEITRAKAEIIKKKDDIQDIIGY